MQQARRLFGWSGLYGNEYLTSILTRVLEQEPLHDLGTKKIGTKRTN